MGFLHYWSLIAINTCFVFPVFEPYKDSKGELLGPKLVFIALNLVGLGLGVWKVVFESQCCV